MNHYPFDICFCSGFWGLGSWKYKHVFPPWPLALLPNTGKLASKLEENRVEVQSPRKQRLDGCLTGLLRWGWWFFLQHTCVHSSLTRGGGCQCDPQEGWTVTDINRAVPGRNPKAPTHPIHPDHICLPAQSCAPSPPPAAAAVPVPLWGWYSEQTAWRHPRCSRAGC